MTVLFRNHKSTHPRNTKNAQSSHDSLVLMAKDWRLGLPQGLVQLECSSQRSAPDTRKISLRRVLNKKVGGRMYA